MEIYGSVGSPRHANTSSNKTDLARTWQQKLQKEVVPVKPDATLLALVTFILTGIILVCVRPPFVQKDTQFKTTLNYTLIVLLACTAAAVVYFVDDAAIDSLVSLVT